MQWLGGWKRGRSVDSSSASLRLASFFASVLLDQARIPGPRHWGRSVPLYVVKASGDETTSIWATQSGYRQKGCMPSPLKTASLERTFVAVSLSCRQGSRWGMSTYTHPTLVTGSQFFNRKEKKKYASRAGRAATQEGIVRNLHSTSLLALFFITYLVNICLQNGSFYLVPTWQASFVCF